MVAQSLWLEVMFHKVHCRYIQKTIFMEPPKILIKTQELVVVHLEVTLVSLLLDAFHLVLELISLQVLEFLLHLMESLDSNLLNQDSLIEIWFMQRKQGQMSEMNFSHLLADLCVTQQRMLPNISSWCVLKMPISEILSSLHKNSTRNSINKFKDLINKELRLVSLLRLHFCKFQTQSKEPLEWLRKLLKNKAMK